MESLVLKTASNKSEGWDDFTFWIASGMRTRFRSIWLSLNMGATFMKTGMATVGSLHNKIHYYTIIQAAHITMTSSWARWRLISPASRFFYLVVCSGADKKHQSSASFHCEGNSPVTGEFPAERAIKAENVSIWWRHHAVVTQQR